MAESATDGTPLIATSATTAGVALKPSATQPASAGGFAPFRRIVRRAAALASLGFAVTASAAPNVILLTIDDLRPELGCYGVPNIHTPNIDALAQRGVVFERAYCQQAVCTPSRTSVLTGRRPDTTKVYDLATHFRDTIPDVVTLPQFFKAHGYHTLAMGKVFHDGLDDPPSWSEPLWRDPPEQWFDPVTRRWIAEQSAARHFKVNPHEQVAGPRGPAWESYAAPEEQYRDAVTARHAVETLTRLKGEGKPFFLAVGFRRPHLPFVAPAKYYDLYPPESIRLPENYFPPQEVPAVALHTFAEVRAYRDTPRKGPLSDEQARALIRGYRASVSFVDAQVGKVMRALDELHLTDNTIVLLWGDHGWHLGDNSLWAKHSNFEVATHAPLVIAGPGVHGGTPCRALVEFVDIYPTLCALAGLPAPAGAEGRSLSPLCANPARPWADAAFSQYPRGKLMGYSLRTERWRYTEWVPTGKLGQGEVAARELYDLEKDPGSTVNLADRREHAGLVAELSARLARGPEVKPSQ